MNIKGKSILIVEDEASLRGLLAKILSLEGFTIFEAGDVATGKDILKTVAIHVVLTDVMLPDSNGIDFTKFIKTNYPLIEVIVLTAFGNVKDGVQAMKLGAFDYITKGDGDEKLPMIASKALEKAEINRQMQEIDLQQGEKSSFGKFIGKSEAMRKTLELAKKVAVTDTTVLLLGETGTGKELLAEAIHQASRRRKGPFITINCAAIPKDLQESELFGHKKGSFTGAQADKKGYLEVADRGTIFLDELGEMSPDLQAKLLRALENRVFNRVGDTEPIPVDIRVIGATNKNLVENEENGFRRDLYYRLSTFAIELPPLRERIEDISVLSLHFMREMAGKAHREINTIDPSFLHCLKNYHWPGNIRELRNVMERAIILADEPSLQASTLPDSILKLETSLVAENAMHETNGNRHEPRNGNLDLKSKEQEHIMRVLNLVKGNKSEAAKKLDIGLATLYRKLKEYNLG